MSANYWNTVNEGGEGYVKRAPAIRSRDEVEFDLRDAERDLASAKINAAYKNNEDGSDYKVERLEAKILKLRAELGLPATPVAAVTPAAALFAAEWTPEVFAARRAVWNAEVAKTKSYGDLAKLQKRLGYGPAELRDAKKILGL